MANAIVGTGRCARQSSTHAIVLLGSLLVPAEAPACHAPFLFWPEHYLLWGSFKIYMAMSGGETDGLKDL